MKSVPQKTEPSFFSWQVLDTNTDTGMTRIQMAHAIPTESSTAAEAKK